VTDLGQHDKPEEPFSWYSFGAQFVEVRVDPWLGEVRVSPGGKRAGTSAASSMPTTGAPVSSMAASFWGIGMALMEHTVFDERKRPSRQPQPRGLSGAGEIPTFRISR